MARKAGSRKRKVVRAKSIKKKPSKKTKTEIVYHSTKEIKVEKALIDNFIGLQKVMVNLSSKFDNLSNQISKLLDLFEISAKALAKKEFSATGDQEAKRVIQKLDSISQQAGLIGKGLALIHEVGTENQNPVIPFNQQRPMTQPVQTMPAPIQVPRKPKPMPIRPPAPKMTSQSPGQTQEENAAQSRVQGFTRSIDTETG